MHRWWAFTTPVWCEFGGFSRYTFYSVPLNINNAFCITVEGLEEEIHTVLEGADEMGKFLIES